MQRVETATSYYGRGKRMSIYKRTAFCDVISKPTRWNQVSRHTMNRETVGRTREVTICIVCLQVNDDSSGRANDISQCVFIDDHYARIRVRTNTKQARSKAGIDKACNAPALELMLIKYYIGNPKDQAASVGIRAAWQPEIDTALLESIFRTIVASVAADHIERLNCCARAITTDHRARIKCISHARLERCVGNHLHCDGLIAAKDVHAIHIWDEEIKVALQVSIRTDKHRSQYGPAGLIG